MTDDQITTIYSSFRTLPSDIREYLTSEQTGEKMSELGNQFVLNNDQLATLSFLLIRLVTQHLPPEQYMNELAKTLLLDTDTAIRLTNTLKTSVLDPIAQALRFNGTDPDLLRFKEAAESTATTPTLMPPTPKQKLPLNKPFILHEEPGRMIADSKPSFTFSTPAIESAPKSSGAPTVIIERVVHYNNFRTSLTQINTSAKKSERGVSVPQSRWFV